MVKRIIMIDLGGVYFTEGKSIAAKKISRKLKIGEGKVYEALKSSPYREGRISSEKFWQGISKKLRIAHDKTKGIAMLWHSSYKPNKGMKALVRKLSKKNKIAILSGNIPERVEFLNNKYKFLNDFHESHFSFNYGVTKPDVRLFRKAMLKMKAKPRDCIVVDDMKEFLSAVKKTGAKTILFKNAKQLEWELKKMGVEI